MASSSLSLRVNNGPKKGETLNCKPGDKIRIGRVIRGNTFTIKDPSISQKHLTLRFLPESTRWAVTDLGSSNGTYLNGALISPHLPAPLAGGDVIRIGTTTSISVHIPVPQPEAIPVQMPEENKSKGRARGRFVKKEVLQPVAMEHRSGRVTRASSRAKTAIVKTEEENIAIAISHSESGEGVAMEKEAQDERVEEEEEEMDNMTTAEWFNRMEEYLPKEINRVAEEIIANLRDKARRFDDYVAPPSNSADG